MSEIGEIAGAIGTIGNLVNGILERSDRDGPEKEYHENIIKIQNAFGDNSMDSDEFRLFIDKLFNDAGSPLTPQGDVSGGKREYLHASLVVIAQSIRDKKLLVKSIFSLQNK